MNVVQDERDAPPRSSSNEGWNPSEFFERFLPRWSANQQLHSSCYRHLHHKCTATAPPWANHPALTLFYDDDTRMTVAVLSDLPRPCFANLVAYFQRRVEEGTAFQRSPLYYELEGYVRENRSQIRKHLVRGQPDSVSIALGSLEASDRVQMEELTEKRYLQLRERHGGSLQGTMDPTRLEQALEIARLHRLGDDLDVLSIFFLRRASKALGRIAARIARDRMLQTTLVLTPYVDGASISGYSNFVRGSGNSEHGDNNVAAAATRPDRLVRHSESGRVVEYERRPAIELRNACARGCRRDDSDGIEPGTWLDSFVPSLASSPSSPPRRGRDRRDPNDGNDGFSWRCEEIALAELHRWWGDICVPDYVGQKLALSWKLSPGQADSAEHQHHHACCSLPLSSLWIEAAPTRGIHQCAMLQSSPCSFYGKGTRDYGRASAAASSSSFASSSSSPARRTANATVDLMVLKSEAVSVDDVTTSYRGRIRVRGVRIGFAALAGAAARCAADRIRDHHARIEETRPLLEHERDYLRQVLEASCL